MNMNKPLALLLAMTLSMNSKLQKETFDFSLDRTYKNIKHHKNRKGNKQR